MPEEPTTRHFAEINFGHPEAERDRETLEHAFCRSHAWKTIQSSRPLPFVVGRKGSGKSAIAVRLEIEDERKPKDTFLKVVPADFRHVEVRQLLARLVPPDASWQYVYQTVWTGILLGQLVRFVRSRRNTFYSLSQDLENELTAFERHCPFYTSNITDALTDALVKIVQQETGDRASALTIVALRKTLEAPNTRTLADSLKDELVIRGYEPITICIDGLDDHWDVSPPSLYFLAEVLRAARDLGARLFPSVLFLVCLRDNIFRALIETRSIEYDKIETAILYLNWDTRSLLELLAIRAFPSLEPPAALLELRRLLPEKVDRYRLDDYLSLFVLRRPRDFINLFTHLQWEISTPSVDAEQLQHAVQTYCSQRLRDLENEFAHTYPGITVAVQSFSAMPALFTRGELLRHLAGLISDPSYISRLRELFAVYGDARRLALVLLSIGALGCERGKAGQLEFVHEFNDRRLADLFDSAARLSLHPVYAQASLAQSAQGGPKYEEGITVITSPSSYLPVDDDAGKLERLDAQLQEKRDDLVARVGSIRPGRENFRQFEFWVEEALLMAFPSDLRQPTAQVTTETKRFELLLDIESNEKPWAESKLRFHTHRLLVECKNHDRPDDGDFSKLDRDMQALGLRVAVLTYRHELREPGREELSRQKARYLDSAKERIIIGLTHGMLIQLLQEGTEVDRRRDFNSLWRSHLERWLVT